MHRLPLIGCCLTFLKKIKPQAVTNSSSNACWRECSSATVFPLSSHHVALAVKLWDKYINDRRTWLLQCKQTDPRSNTAQNLRECRTWVTSSQGEGFAHICRITQKEEHASHPKWSKHESCYYMSNAPCRALCLLRGSIMCAILFWSNHAIWNVRAWVLSGVLCRLFMQPPETWKKYKLGNFNHDLKLL